MKTSEFVKRMEDIDLSVEVRGSYIEVYYKMHKIMVIQRNELWGINTRYYGFFNTTPENVRKVAISEAVEYINTPLEKREEPNKYYLKLPKDFIGEKLYDKRIYLNLDKSKKKYYFESKEETENFQTQFTQEEIDKLDIKHLIKEEVK